MSKKRLEKHYVEDIRKMLKKYYPGFYFKVHGGPFQKAGIPDILGCHRGILIAIEVKTPEYKHKLSSKQKQVISTINNMGGIAFMARTQEEAKEILDERYPQVMRRIYLEYKNTLQASKKSLEKESKKSKVRAVHGTRDRKDSSGNKDNRRKIQKGRNK